MPIHPDFFQIVWQLREEKPHQLALAKSQKFAPFLPADVATQVAALQKVARKIPSWHRAGLYFPQKIALEQCSSERTAHFKSQLFAGNTLLDLTCGLGVDAYFFSKKFKKVIAIEQNEALAMAARHNFSTLETFNLAIEHSSAETFLQNTSLYFDLIFCDPARRSQQGNRVFRLTDCSPNILAIRNLIFEKTSRLLLKTAPMLDLHEAMQQLGSVQKIWVVGTPDECREILLEVAAAPVALPNEVPIEAITLKNDGSQFVLTFSLSIENQSVTSFSKPLQFLYEPPPSILKAGAFKFFAERWGLQKLHPNTHLYTSQTFHPSVEGRIFEIIGIEKYDRRSVCRHLPDGRAHLATRNFPASPEEIRKKLGLQDGGTHFLFGITDIDEQKRILICKKIDSNS